MTPQRARRQRRGIIGAALLLVIHTAAADPYTAPREQMVRLIEADVVATRSHIGRQRLDPKVLEAMREVPRHEFVPPDQVARAYLNRPLPIGHGQTISQPYIVALMTDLLELESDDRVLEIGTGSGYQAAVLAHLCEHLHTIEIIEPLARDAAARLKRLGYDRIRTRAGDGYYGWKEYAPYDAIIVTAAASHVPPPLIEQLRPGGRILIPVGSRFTVQQLVLVKKNANGTITTRQILPVRFVPLTGGH